MSRLFSLLFLACVPLSAAFGQSYSISTFAGGGLPNDVPGTAATLYPPQSVATDPAGNAVFSSGAAVFRLSATTGILTVVAGTGIPGFSGDNGPATSAQLGAPLGGVAVDSTGRIYIADIENLAVFWMVANGVITTIAGTGTPGFTGDNGPATEAQIEVSGLAAGLGGDLYFTEPGGAPSPQDLQKA